MDERTFRPDEMLVFAPVTTYSIRITGPNLDVSLGIASAEDIEIFEKLLAKIRASVSASSDSGKV